MLYGWVYPNFLLVIVITLAYSTIAPIILPVGILYFGLAYVIYLYQVGRAPFPRDPGDPGFPVFHRPCHPNLAKPHPAHPHMDTRVLRLYTCTSRNTRQGAHFSPGS